MKRLIVGGLVLVMMSGCVSMRSSEKREYEILERELANYNLDHVEEKNPVAAGVLNVMPGFGNLYLEQYGAFVGNLLLWPVSVVWAAPQGYIDATTMNKQETLYFYRHSLGQQELAAAKADYELKLAAVSEQK